MPVMYRHDEPLQLEPRPNVSRQISDSQTVAHGE